jgi:hypothetical protein
MPAPVAHRTKRDRDPSVCREAILFADRDPGAGKRKRLEASPRHANSDRIRSRIDRRFV